MAPILILSVVGICTVLAQIVLVLQFPGGRLYLGIDLLAAVSHLGDLLKHNRIMYGFKWVPAPGEGTMVLAQASDAGKQSCFTEARIIKLL